MSFKEEFTPGAVRRNDAFLQLARAVGAFLHESQRERGVSALHVKSGRRLFAAELATARSRTEARRRGAASLVESLGPDVITDAAGRTERIAAATEAVAVMRDEIQRGVAVPQRVVDAFTGLNTELLAAIDACVAQVAEGETRCLAIASLSLMHAKEKTGLERARLGAAFVGDGPDASDRLALVELMASRATYLHAYAMTAPSPAAQMLRRVMAAPPAVEVRRIEDRVISLDVALARTVDAGAWFTTITRTIEMLGDVADATLSYFPHH